MTTPQHEHLSRRERQIMDVIYQKGKATAAEVMDQIPDAPSYSAVRALMRILVEKGHLSYALSGNRYIYKPTVSRQTAKHNALQHVLSTFFEGSVSQAMVALLDLTDELPEDELERLSVLIEKAKNEGK
ncbi:MAG: BlaI/MecI/CopY family transcriptional regulator [Rhodothermales bacterium]|nr:BlaI/MecI/CopY family transcriptional regulator [Rhodothermales bacterium]